MTTYSGTSVSGGTWKTIGRTMLRTMLNDAGAATYTNARLDELLITAAYFLPQQINFITSYAIDIDAESITPDPVDTSDDGVEFINFMVLKSACMLDEGSFRTAALLQGLKARCGPAVIETNSHGQYLRNLILEGPCKTFDTLKHEYNFSYNGKKIIRAVMSPFASNDFTPSEGLPRNRDSF